MNKNTNTSNSNSTSTSTSTGSSNSISGVGANSNTLDSQLLSIMQGQLLEALEKLDFILANQQRLESQLAAQGILLAVDQAQNGASINA